MTEAFLTSEFEFFPDMISVLLVVFPDSGLSRSVSHQVPATFSICQSMGSIPFSSRYRLVFEKGLLPKNPRYADKGLGCGDFNTRCFGL